MSNAAQLAVAAYIPGRRRNANGACNVQQRASVAVTAGSAVYGGPDRYKASNTTSAGGQFTQSAGTITYNGVARPAIVQTVNTAATNLASANYWSGILTYLEGFDVYDMVGQPVAIQFVFQASVIGNYSVALRDQNATYSYVTSINVAVANTPQLYEIQIPAIPLAATMPFGNGIALQLWIGAQNVGGATYNTATRNTWLNGNYIAASNLVTWATTVGATISLTDLQIESGPACTPFERRSQAAELALCQRYYNVTSCRVDVGLNSAGNISSMTMAYPAPMRAVATNAIASAIYGGSASGATFNSFQSGTTTGIAVTYGNQSTTGAATLTVANNAEL